MWKLKLITNAGAVGDVKMKQIGWSVLLTLTIILTACGSPTPAVVAAATPALTDSPAGADAPSNIVVASARIVPARVSYIGFAISAPVKEVAVAEGDGVQAGQTLVVLDTPELDFAVAAADASLRSAQANLFTRNRDKYKFVDGYGRVFYYTVPHEVAQIARAQVQQAQSALAVAQATLAQSTLIAPYAGTVVSVNIIPGELAQVGQSVLTLANLNALQVETTDLSERDITRVKIGQTVNVYIEALDVTVTGKVIRISPISETVGGDIVYPVTIELDEQPDGLLWGMTAEVEIQTK
jgi:RND family efflux transporter MFP subunit